MPYMFDTVTNKDSSGAVSQAANTSRTMGILLARLKCVFRIIRFAIMRSDNIIPSRHHI